MLTVGKIEQLTTNSFPLITQKPTSSCTGRSDCSDHNESWKRHFIVPIAKEMKKRGVGYMAIIIRDDGKASFVLEPNAESEALT
jgi:hypothetical protein